MKRLLLMVAFFLVSSFNLFGGWTLQKSGVNGILHDVHFVDTRHGWIAADKESRKGAMLRTTNGGKNWQIIHTSSKYSLYCIGFLDSLGGWVGGNKEIETGSPWGPSRYSLLLHTTDGGKTWQNKKSITTPEITSARVSAICIADSICGFYISGGAHQTSGDFTNWLSIGALKGARGSWYRSMWCQCIYGIGICFLNSLNGWVLMYDGSIGGGPFLLYTEKGVDSLSVIYEFSLTSRLEDIYFADILHGWVVGDNGIIYHTVDAGSTWVEQTSGATSCLYAVDFLDSLNGWVAGDNGVILRTRDGGENWVKERTPTSSKINSICFIDTSYGWAVGDNGKILCYTSYGVEESEKLKVQSAKLMIEPNPFRSCAIINYELPVGSKVSLKVYDVVGRVVKVLVDGEVYSGYHKVEWNAEKFPSGIYFASLVAPNYKTSKKLILTK